MFDSDSARRRMTAEAVRAASGRLAVSAAAGTYLSGGAFAPGRMVAVLRDAVDRAVADGYDGMYVIGEMSWSAPGDAPGRSGWASTRRR
ncbi:MEDS domain-containing protein [Sphaerisporangium sp. NPDC088356]|uniref:MEDS domain-containing protein n=1 Tax=Sphaerisporangium sp. NPDC088356 TaxID=3154871 RepID=UPI00341CC98B